MSGNPLVIGKAWAKMMESKKAINSDLSGYYLPQEEEHAIREKHPAVKEAWERYQVILKLYETQNGRE
jgi:hypothetical protein